MRTKFKLFCLSVAFGVSITAARADNPCVTTFNTTEQITSYPTINDSYLVPEPGLTNETMTLYGGFEYLPGTLQETITASGCQNYTETYNFPWGLSVSDLSWATYFLSGTTPLNEGLFQSEGQDNITFVTPDWGDQYAIVDLFAEATFENTNYQVLPPANPLFIPFSILPRRPLIHLSFDNNSLVGDRGQLPTIATNITLAPSPFGNGIDFDSSTGIDLEYPFFQSDVFSVTSDNVTTTSTGTPNARRNEGTIRFWFQPHWTSGSGPANGGVFFDMFEPGIPSSDLWTLNLTANGSAIELDNAGGGFSQPINFASGQWYQITVTYSPTETILYTNGVQAGATGSGVAAVPGAVSLFGIRIGSDGANKQVRGILDEVRTYNYEMPASEVLSDYNSDCAIDTDGAGTPNLVQFESGIDPSDPPGGNPNPLAQTSGSGAPVIQLLEPINASQN